MRVRTYPEEGLGLELANLLDELCDEGGTLVRLDLEAAELDVVGWVVVERAIGRFAARGVALEVESGAHVEMPAARRLARRWLVAIRDELT